MVLGGYSTIRYLRFFSGKSFRMWICVLDIQECEWKHFHVYIICGQCFDKKIYFNLSFLNYFEPIFTLKFYLVFAVETNTNMSWLLNVMFQFIYYFIVHFKLTNLVSSNSYIWKIMIIVMFWSPTFKIHLRLWETQLRP